MNQRENEHEPETRRENETHYTVDGHHYPNPDFAVSSANADSAPIVMDGVCDETQGCGVKTETRTAQGGDTGALDRDSESTDSDSDDSSENEEDDDDEDDEEDEDDNA